MTPRAPATPTFQLTFDTELIWGSFDHMSAEDHSHHFPDVRGTIEAILTLVEHYEVPATWAVVGHLFLDRCERDRDGVAHPELPRPDQSWRPGDWYADDPCTDRERDPLWYGADIVDLLQSASELQEIGSHSFGHVLFGDPALERAAVEADLARCVALAGERGIRLRSFVFPRNSEGHHAALREAGFSAFRGADPVDHGDLPRPLRRASHLAAHVAGRTPTVSTPTERLPGLWDIPGSTLFIHRTGPRRLVSRRARVRRAKAGLERAVRDGGSFHLWTHPFNLAGERAYMLGVLDEILTAAVRARDRGHLLIESMGQVADRLGDPS